RSRARRVWIQGKCADTLPGTVTAVLVATAPILARSGRGPKRLFPRLFDLFDRFLLVLLRLEREPVGNVILVDIADVSRRLEADLVRDHDLHVVEPFVRIETSLLGNLPAFGDVAGPAVVAGESEECPVLLVEARAGKILRHEMVHVFRAGVNVVFGDVDVA